MEQILILLAKKKKNEGVPKYFLKGRQIKILKLLYKKKIQLKVAPPRLPPSHCFSFW